MERITGFSLDPRQASLWFLGQSGYVVRAGASTVVIDPYLSDAAAAASPECRRMQPAPLSLQSLHADFYIVTHAHLDHLDPDTVTSYRYKATTTFVAPRLAARRLESLGVQKERIAVVEAGDVLEFDGLKIEGVFALPTGPDVLDTTGYCLRFDNGRTVYHASDTAFHPLVLEAAPKDVEVLLVPINGKWRNLTVDQACDLTAAVAPQVVSPNHYDMMAINSENPESFRFALAQRGITVRCMIAEIMRPFIWE